MRSENLTRRNIYVYIVYNYRSSVLFQKEKECTSYKDYNVKHSLDMIDHTDNF